MQPSPPPHPNISSRVPHHAKPPLTSFSDHGRLLLLSIGSSIISPSLMVNGRRPVSSDWLCRSVRTGATTPSCALYTSAGMPSGPALFPGPVCPIPDTWSQHSFASLTPHTQPQPLHSPSHSKFVKIFISTATNITLTIYQEFYEPDIKTCVSFAINVPSRHAAALILQSSFVQAIEMEEVGSFLTGACASSHRMMSAASSLSSAHLTSGD